MSKTSSSKSPLALLKDCFNDRGYLRVPVARAAGDPRPPSKKGYEARFVVETAKDLAAIRKALKALGLPVASAFQKHSSHVQPLYGKEAVMGFLKKIQQAGKLESTIAERAPAKPRAKKVVKKKAKPTGPPKKMGRPPKTKSVARKATPKKVVKKTAPKKPVAKKAPAKSKTKSVAKPKSKRRKS